MYCRDTESGRRTVEPTDLEPGNVASLDVKTAFDVAKPSKVSRILSSTGIHGHAAAALLAEMQDVQGSACFANCETEFRCSKCIRQGGSNVVESRGQMRVMESRGKVEHQRDLPSGWRTTTSVWCEA